ncbi:MAG: hypothetical protein ACTSYM_05860 [Candidatus Baldrarchaeia archaeon]
MKPEVYFYIDSCIPLSLLFEQPFKTDVEKFLEDVEKNNLQCFMPTSVSKECEEIISKLSDLTKKTLKGVIARFEIERGKDPKISKKDFLALEEYFSSRFWGRSGKSTEQEILRTIQSWFIRKVEEKLTTEKEISISEVAMEILNENIKIFLRKQALFEELMFKYWSEIDIKPNLDVMKVLEDNVKIKNQKDREHLASVMQHSWEHNSWPIFVTTDYKDILTKSMELRKWLIHCSYPLFAVHWLDNIKNGFGKGFSDYIKTESKTREVKILKLIFDRPTEIYR